MRLVVRLKPVPYECLSSLLERLRRANHYEESEWFQSLLPQPVQGRIDLLRSTQQLDVLASLTRLSVDTLYQLTLHRFVSAFYGETFPQLQPTVYDINRPLWQVDGLNTFVHGANTIRLCPLCWKEQQAFLLPWFLRHVTTCQKHRVLLVDTCCCGTPLSSSLSHGYCKRCKTHAHQLPVTSITESSVNELLMTLVWTAIGCADESFPPPSVRLSDTHPIKHMSSPTFLKFLWYGAQLIRRYDPTNPVMGDISSDALHNKQDRSMRTENIATTHARLTAMTRILIEWPEVWHTTLAHIADREGLAPTYTPRFPSILLDTFQGEAWHWLHHGWMDYVLQHAFTDERSYYWLPFYRTAHTILYPDTLPQLLSQTEAARLLQVGEPAMKQIIAAGLVRTTIVPERDTERQWQLIPREDVERLQHQWEQRWSLSQTAAYLGIGEDSVEALVKAGMLKMATPSPLDGQMVWVFTEPELQDSLVRLLGHIPIVPDVCTTMVSLSEALRIVSGAGVSLPELLHEVQQQTIHATRISHTCTLNELFLDSEDVCRYAAEQRDVASQGFCSMQQVLERLRCKPRTLQRLNDAGLLIPHQKGNAQRWLYRQEDIEAFLAHYIDSDAAAVILGCTRITVQQWVRSGRLTAITGPEIDGSHVYRFEKVALIQWRHERVTFGEAVQIIGKSRATLHRWVEQGNLQPLDGIGGKHRWFWRADVEQLADTHSRGQ